MMKPLHFAPILAAVAALATACGGAGAASSGAGSSQAASKSPVNTQKVDGVGTVLVDTSGKTLYFAQQENAHKVLCTGSCGHFWFPLTTGKSATKSGNLPMALHTVKRPDGKTQVTYAGHPLYTFSQDGGAGNAKGNGFKDTFGGTHFTWHAITPKGAAAGSKSSSGGGGGYGGGY